MKTWVSKLFGNSPQPVASSADAERTIPASIQNDRCATQAAEVPVEWQVGDVIRDLYEVREVHGGGGMGLVYRMYCRDWEREMAVKSPRAEYFQNQAQKENFVRECLTWVGLGLHAHIVCCFYVRVMSGIPRVFAEYVEGGSLKDWIESRRLYEGGPERALERILDVAIQFAWGLQYAHEHGLIHQDVKPGNVLLTTEGVVRVTDFGLAKARAAAGEVTMAAAGASLLVSSGGLTPAYCSPEQAEIAALRRTSQPEQAMLKLSRLLSFFGISGRCRSDETLPKLTRRTDIWSWAISVMEMFMGEPPCQHGQTAAEVFEQFVGFDQGDPALPRMPEGLVELVRHCFQRNPDARPGDFGSIVERLREIYCGVIGSEYPREMPERVEALADALNNEGISLLDLGMQEEAECKFAEALNSDPNHPEATYNQGLLLWRSARKPDLALVRSLEALATAGPSGDRARFLLALAHIDRGDAESAAKALDGAPGFKEKRTLALARSGAEKWGRCLRRFYGHQTWVNSVAISPDGRWALSGSHDKTLRLWELATGRCLRVFEGHQDIVNSVAISPDSRWALSGSEDTTLRLWELATGECLRTFEGHWRTVKSVAIGPDGRWALSGSEDGQLRLWDLATGECLRVCEIHQYNHPVNAVAISPDGRWAVSGSNDTVLQFWELATGKCLRVFEGHQSQVGSVAISSDGRWVLSGSWDTTLKLWELATSQCLRTFEGHTGFVNAATISPDGRWALSASWDATVRLWDVATGQCLRTFEGREILSSVGISPDGRWALSGGYDNTLRLWELATGIRQDFREGQPVTSGELIERSRRVKQFISVAAAAAGNQEMNDSLAALRSARTIPGYERNPNLLDCWTEVGQYCRKAGSLGGWCLRIFEGHQMDVKSVAISPDGRWALSGSSDKTLRRWDLATGRCLRAVEVQGWGVDSVAISPDGCWALSGTSDNKLGLWELATGQCLRTFEGHGSNVNSVAISPDGRWALSGSRDNTLRLWELGTGGCLRIFRGHKKNVDSVAISPDGRWALSGSEDGTIRLWELATGQCLRTFEGRATSVAFSPDGRWALSGASNWVGLWELATGQDLRTFKGPGDSVAISPDGRWVLSGGYDQNLRLWEIATGQCLRTFEGHGGSVNSVAISPNGRWALSGSADKTLRLWELDWDFEFHGWADWDDGAGPWLTNFLTLHTPTGGKKPQWTEDDFNGFLKTLCHAGYGWLRPEGVRRELEKMIVEWQGPPPLQGE